jgi:hypothetical protein
MSLYINYLSNPSPLEGRNHVIEQIFDQDPSFKNSLEQKLSAMSDPSKKVLTFLNFLMKDLFFSSPLILIALVLNKVSQNTPIRFLL